MITTPVVVPSLVQCFLVDAVFPRVRVVERLQRNVLFVIISRRAFALGLLGFVGALRLFFFEWFVRLVYDDCVEIDNVVVIAVLGVLEIVLCILKQQRTCNSCLFLLIIHPSQIIALYCITFVVVVVVVNL